MSAFLWTMFWLHIVGVLCWAAVIATSEYPRKRKPETIGSDVISLLVKIGFLMWICYLLFVVR